MTEHLSIIPILLFSVIIHEIAHGWTAWKLGDPTARDMGRLTLNPIPHIDLFGSIILPLMSLTATGSVFIAWAKPVPVNPANFSRPRRDDILVSFAGPASNIVLSGVCTGMFIACSGLARYVNTLNSPGLTDVVMFFLTMFYNGVYLNIVLAMFNMIPIPPLDGSHIFASFLPPEAAIAYRKIGFFGIIAILFLMRVPVVAKAFHDAIIFLASPFEHLMGISL